MFGVFDFPLGAYMEDLLTNKIVSLTTKIAS